MTPSELAVYVERVLARAGLTVSVSNARSGYMREIARMEVEIRAVNAKKLEDATFAEPVFEEGR